MGRSLKHAFAVDPPGPATPTEEQQPAVDWVCRKVISLGLQTPAMFGLEMGRPYNYLASQVGHYGSPVVWTMVARRTYTHYKQFMLFLEQRGSLEYLQLRIDELEEIDAEAAAREAETKKEHSSDESESDSAGGRS